MATLVTQTTVILRDSAGLQVTSAVSTESYETAAGEYLVAEYHIPDASVDYAVDLGHLSGLSRAVLVSDRDVTVQVGADNANTRALPAGGAMALAWTTPETLIYVTNASGETATVKAVMVE